MRATGIVRHVDKLGRVVIPMEIRKRLGVIDDRDSFEFFVEGENIVLKKYQEGCVFCGDDAEGIIFDGQTVCKKCLKKLTDSVKKS